MHAQQNMLPGIVRTSECVCE